MNIFKTFKLKWWQERVKKLKKLNLHSLNNWALIYWRHENRP